VGIRGLPTASTDEMATGSLAPCAVRAEQRVGRSGRIALAGSAHHIMLALNNPGEDGGRGNDLHPGSVPAAPGAARAWAAVLGHLQRHPDRPVPAARADLSRPVAGAVRARGHRDRDGAREPPPPRGGRRDPAPRPAAGLALKAVTDQMRTPSPAKAGDPVNAGAAARYSFTPISLSASSAGLRAAPSAIAAR